MSISADQVRELREKTGAGMMDCKSALVEAKGDAAAAVDILRKKGLASAAKKAGRAANDGVVASYIHPGAKVGVLRGGELRDRLRGQDRPSSRPWSRTSRCTSPPPPPPPPSTSPRTRSPRPTLEKEKEIYKAQAAAQGKPANVQEKIAEGKLKEFYATFCLLEQPFVKDPKITVGELVQEKVAIIKENIVIRRFARFRVGEEIQAPAAAQE